MLPARSTRPLATILLLTLILAGLAGCTSGPTVWGNGRAATESREVGDWDCLSLSGIGDVRLTIGPPGPIEIRGDENILPLVTTKVEGGRLVIGTQGSIHPRVHLTFTASVPRLREVSVSGAGDIEVTGLEADELEVSVSGAGDIDLAGRADRLAVRVSGAGDIEAEDLVTREVDVHVSGAGNAHVHATDKLTVSISGAGSVRYAGNPQVTQSISGVGSLKHRGKPAPRDAEQPPAGQPPAERDAP